MDTVTLVIIVILLIVAGIFVGTQFGGSNSGDSVRNSNLYPSQQYGGACGR